MFTRPTVHPHVHYYAPAPNRRGIKRCFCLTSVCLSRISGLSREQRGLGRPKLAAEVAHVTGNSDTTFKVKKSRSALLTAALARQAAAAVGVGTCWPCCYVAVCSAARGAAPTVREERGGGISWRPPAYSLFYLA